MAAVAEREQEQEQEQQERATTTYIVMTSPAEDGPWTRLGEFAGRSQREAKRAAVAQKSSDPNAQPPATELYFIALSTASYKPERPTVKTTTAIAF